MELDLSSLSRAVQRLREGLARQRQEPEDEQLRDGLIQRFEFAYELTHRTLKRYLKETTASPDEIESAWFADLIRTASAQGLLHGDWSNWRDFRRMRTRTSHTYNAETAAEVAAGVPAFLVEAEHLLDQLRRRLKA
jgi:nucleotidyltransferase substrate binding protein (TIGR01987 family)